MQELDNPQQGLRLTVLQLCDQIATMSPTGRSSPAMEFLVESLKKDKSASYADLRAKADEKKLKVFPIMYGRAKAILGLVKVSPRGQGKVAKAQAAMVRRGRRGPHANSKSARIRELLGSGMSVAEIAKKVGATTALVYVVKSSSGRGTKRGPGRPRKVASTGRGSVNGLDGLLEAVKNSERERTQMRAALEKIQTVIAEALG